VCEREREREREREMEIEMSWAKEISLLRIWDGSGAIIKTPLFQQLHSLETKMRLKKMYFR
jgi:hypothetical protein